MDSCLKYTLHIQKWNYMKWASFSLLFLASVAYEIINFKILTVYRRHGYLSRHQTVWVRCMILIFVLHALIELVDLAGQFFLSILKLRTSKSVRFWFRGGAMWGQR